MLRPLVYLLPLAFLGSCQWFSGSKVAEEKPVARVYDQYLYAADFHGVGSGAALPEDSILAVRNYIDSWVRHNLLLRYAMDNLPEEEQKINKQLQDYKESLLIYLYEKALLDDKLDTVVTEAEIRKYYDGHRETFSLKNSIARMKYIVLLASEKIYMDSVRYWMNHPGAFTSPKLTGFSRDYAIRYAVGDSLWYNKAELESLLPVHRFNLDNALFSRSYLEVVDSSYRYLIKFDDYRFKGSDAPIEFVRKDIANIIINKRRMAFIGSIHKSIYDEALKNSDFEIMID